MPFTSHLPRHRTLTAVLGSALLALGLATPTAPARADPRPPSATDAAAQAQRVQDLRHLKAGNSVQTSSLAGTTPPTVTEPTPADIQRALGQERTYSSYGRPTPVPPAAQTLAGDVSDGIAPLPFGLSVLGALIVGVGAGLGLHRMQLRRRGAGLPA
jgi:hypothetical protein